MAPKRVRRQPRVQTREQMLDAAARVVARRGFHGASVEAVSEEAGFSTGALYSNFKGKDDLFLALYEERIERRGRELREAFADAGPAPALANVSDVMGRERDWFLLYFEFVLHAARDKKFARRFRAVRNEGLAELAAGLADGLKQAGIETDADTAELACVIRAVSYGAALDHLVEPGAASEAIVGRALELIFRGFYPEGVIS